MGQATVIPVQSVPPKSCAAEIKKGTGLAQRPVPHEKPNDRRVLLPLESGLAALGPSRSIGPVLAHRVQLLDEHVEFLLDGAKPLFLVVVGRDCQAAAGWHGFTHGMGC